MKAAVGAYAKPQRELWAKPDTPKVGKAYAPCVVCGKVPVAQTLSADDCCYACEREVRKDACW